MLKMLLVPLVATIVIELGVLLFLGERHKQVMTGSVAMNVLTNVPLNLFVLYVDDGLCTVVVGEVFVVVVEALCYKRLVGEWWIAWIYSLLCNSISFLTGELFMLIYYLFTTY
jgi:hypothetical protein